MLERIKKVLEHPAGALVFALIMFIPIIISVFYAVFFQNAMRRFRNNKNEVVELYTEVFTKFRYWLKTR